jgi:PAS domain S-box-containing protein
MHRDEDMPASPGSGAESYRLLNRQLHAIFESSPDGIWVCDGRGKVISLNGASERLNGVKDSDVIGQNVADMITEGLFDRSVTLEVLETRRQVSIIQHIRKTERTLLTTGTPVFDEQGDISMVVVNERDLTQLNRVRQELEQSRMITEKYRDELAGLTALELGKHEIIAESPAMRQVLVAALKLAQVDASNILILGESGTGKGLLAKFIHKNGKRSKEPFIQINCAALPENLLEAELFGYEKGAFTGARAEGKAGLIELARGGALFLDEIGDLPLPLQGKLLKYLDDFEVLRLGGLKPVKVDCTIVAATNQDLDKLVLRGLFRQDLFYRLNTFTVRIPPLRERGEDVFELTSHFLKKYNHNYRTRRRISPEALNGLQAYPFPGNVRELKSILKRAVLLGEKDLLDESILGIQGGAALPWSNRADEKKGSDLAGFVDSAEHEVLERAVRRCGTTRELARYLGISQPTAVRKLRKHGLSLRDSLKNQKRH